MMNTENQKMYPKFDEQPQSVPNQPPSYNYATSPMQAPPVIVQQPTTVFVQQPNVGPNPQSMSCPHCRSVITTRTILEPNTKTHLFAALICLLGCWCGCCLIPYCTDSCQGVTHTCPSCGNFLGKYEN